jgi:hypothetical protein
MARIARDSKLAVARFGLGTSSAVFSTEKTHLRCSILAQKQINLLFHPTNKNCPERLGGRDSFLFVDTSRKRLNHMKDYLSRFWVLYQNTPNLQKALANAV